MEPAPMTMHLHCDRCGAVMPNDAPALNVSAQLDRDKSRWFRGNVEIAPPPAYPARADLCDACAAVVREALMNVGLYK